ncbi:MAG: TlyA family RNA methyltransferase [Sneathiella sp.]
MTNTRNRLDNELTTRNLAPSRARAQSLISDGLVRLNGEITKKASLKVTSSCKIEVDKNHSNWVGRGAYKLIAALDHFNFDPKDRIVADLGASTGGFSQVLLARGAQKVYSIDVGHDQLHKNLVSNEKIVNLEGVNARYLTVEEVPDPLDMIVVDVSFISLKKMLPAPLALCKPGCILAALVKPQFEVGKGNLGKGGVVRDTELAEKIREDMEYWFNNLPGWRCLGSIESPITGSDGNTEYLLGAIFDA